MHILLLRKGKKKNDNQERDRSLINPGLSTEMGIEYGVAYPY